MKKKAPQKLRVLRETIQSQTVEPVELRELAAAEEFSKGWPGCPLPA